MKIPAPIIAVAFVLAGSIGAGAAEECRYIQNTANIICETKPAPLRVAAAADEWIARNKPLWLTQGLRNAWTERLSPICGIIAEFCK